MALDRRTLVRRHNPVLHSFRPDSPFSVGNGEFAFTADCTGLQTFPDAHADHVPLCTQSQWGWHSFPFPRNFVTRRLRLREYDTYGRRVGYASSMEGQEELYDYLRQNPHRLNLGTIGFAVTGEDGRQALPADVHEILQELDLWTGVLESRNRIFDIPLSVVTACHPTHDALSVRAASKLCADGRLSVAIRFPYGSPGIGASDWKSPLRHATEIILEADDRCVLLRQLDDTRYYCVVTFQPGMQVRRSGRHEFSVSPARGSDSLSLTVEFFGSMPDETCLSVDEVETASSVRWERFWTDGGCIDLSGSTDPSAGELERRIVLSQYLTAVQCAGSYPPQETGLTCNSWYGKFHHEMHYWHAAHFPLWNRSDLLERSLWWYTSILEKAKGKAVSQGYDGVRWPKMTGPDGMDSPSPIGPLLIWQQPHLIMFAELLYRSKKSKQEARRVLETYDGLVSATADFMASFAFFDGSSDRFVLGPPVIPAQENHSPETTVNPAFELEYWNFGLRTANEWRIRQGYGENAGWSRVLEKLSRLPAASGVYLAHEHCPDTFTRFNRDHPSMLAALGMLPGRLADRSVMNATLDAVLSRWDFDETWGWDFPMIAMTAARLGRPRDAVDALLMDRPKNTYLPNGHNPQSPKKDLPLYLPGNGALLIAVALMAAGWDGSTGHAPGFPKDGSWRVEYESILPVP